MNLATTSVTTKVSFHHGQNQPFDPIDGIQVTTAAQTPAEVAESTGRADSSVNKRPALTEFHVMMYRMLCIAMHCYTHHLETCYMLLLCDPK